MENKELYPELIDYIYQYCDEFKTEDEKMAGRSILYNEENMTVKIRDMLINKGWYSDAPHIKSMMSEGRDSLKRKVVERIFLKHKDELKLNLCPKCSKITRTPLAKQCQFCFYNWHKKDE